MTVAISALTDTWNNGATVFTGLKLTVTDTASDATSLLMDIQTAALGSRFKVGRTGTTTISNAGSSAFLTCSLDGFGTVFNISGGGDVTVQNSFTTTAGDIHSGGQVVLNSGQNLVWNGLTILTTAVAAVLEQRNSTTAQTFRVYNTYTDASNYERGVFDWTTTANTLTIDVQVLGSGTQRVISLNHLDSATGAGTATFAATNCPASTLTSPYTWVKVTSSDGSIVYMPAWK